MIEKSRARSSLNARVALAFDEKEYLVMYNTSRELAERFTDLPMAILSYASGAACMYALTNDQQYRQESEERIAYALSLRSGNENGELDEYIQRIRHRIESREIIDSDEYYRRYPLEAKEM